MPALLQHRATNEVKLHEQSKDDEAASDHPPLLRLDVVQCDDAAQDGWGHGWWASACARVGLGLGRGLAGVWREVASGKFRS